MVMRNRGDGSNAPHWWDDLPPKVRERFHTPLVPADDTPRGASGPAMPGRGAFVADLSRLAILFALVTGAILLYLLIAVRYVTD